MITFLQGKKTYLLGIIALVAFGLGSYGVIDVSTANIIIEACGLGSIITLRAAISKVGQ